MIIMSRSNFCRKPFIVKLDSKKSESNKSSMMSGAGVAFYLVTSYKLSHVEDRLAKFVREYFKDFLTKLTYEAFAEQKRTATKQKLKRPQKMEDVTALCV